MADSLISVLLKKLASIAYQQIETEVRLVLDVKKQVTKVTSNLKAIRAVLDDAEKKQVTEDTVRDWLEKLKDVSYDMDDVLDEWHTEIMLQVDKQENDGENVLVTKKKVCFSIPSHCFCFGGVSRIILRRDIALKIKDLNDELDEIAKERATFKFEIKIEQPERHKSVSFVDMSKTFGRGNESKVVVDMLLSDSSEDEEGPLVIPIVGMGGMGKTTLAQLAYNNKNVVAHFDKRIWVCVSDPFDEIRIAKAIIAGDGNRNLDEKEALFQCLSKSIEGKKFLIVLDDVWKEWKELKLPLQSGAKGSRILVTTRNKDVAIRMGARQCHMMQLEQLSEQSCWLLFSHIAFFDREKESHLFEAIGRKIVKKCKGLPLVAKCLGSLMQFKTTKKEWQEVLDSKIWELKKVEQEVFQPLLLSYYDLESATKCCLLYCVIFPKDYVFKKDTLIELWMSQDYLISEGNQEKQTVGQNHFNDLVRRSFFQDFKRDYEGKVTVKMHDIVHDFVQFLTKKEYFLMEVRDASKRIKLPDYKVRHLTLVLDKGGDYQVSLLVSSENYKNMRSLTNLRSGYGYYTLDFDFILQLKGLRTLNLNSNQTEEVPKGIGELLHLRYVDLSANGELKELPDSICNLYNLETLRLDWCGKLERLPKGIGKLINLKHLHVKGCRELKLPKEIGRLTSLRVLNVENVCGVEENDALTLGDLRSLDKLRSSLCIKHLSCNVSVSEAEKAHLQNKKDLLRLELHFDYKSEEDVEGNVENHVGVLNALQPPPNLEYLEIHGYFGITIPPSWISLHSLRSLNIHDWNCEVLPPLGQLRSLETLRIDNMRGLRKIGVEFLGIPIQEKTHTLSKSPSPTATTSFPKLKHLTFEGNWDWEEWEGVGGSTVENSEITIMPCLSSLKISCSPRLRSLPDFRDKTPQLRALNLLYTGFLEEGCREGGEERARVSHIPNITINGSTVRNGGVWIPKYDETDKSDASASKEGDDDDEIIQE